MQQFGYLCIFQRVYFHVFYKFGYKFVLKLFLIFSFLYPCIFNYMYPYFTFPFHYFAMYGSIYMTIAISVERVLAICYPFLFPPLDRKSRHYIIPVTLTGMYLRVIVDKRLLIKKRGKLYFLLTNPILIFQQNQKRVIF